MVHVVFHVGAHKCATTSVQAGLAEVAAGEPRLTYVPPARVPKAHNDFVVCPELHALNRLVGRGAEAETQLDGVVDGLCRLIDSHGDQERIVFSDENMIGGMPGLRWSFYPNAGVARAAIEAVARRFPTSVFLQSRDTASYLRSSHQFRAGLGLTLGYAAFLERYDLDSISWVALAQTLFDGAPYDWRVLPIERLKDASQVAEVATALNFVVPGWDLAKTPLRVANRSNGPLTRAAALVFLRSGRKFDGWAGGPVSEILDAAAPAVALAGEQDAVRLIGEALERAGISATPRIVHLIRSQFDEEREPEGHLHRLLVDRFAPDYAAFLERYAGGGDGAIASRSGGTV